MSKTSDLMRSTQADRRAVIVEGAHDGLPEPSSIRAAAIEGDVTTISHVTGAGASSLVIAVTMPATAGYMYVVTSSVAASDAATVTVRRGATVTGGTAPTAVASVRQGASPVCSAVIDPTITAAGDTVIVSRVSAQKGGGAADDAPRVYLAGTTATLSVALDQGTGRIGAVITVTRSPLVE